MWLYQGWAIRGWNNAEGASRLKALYDVVPHGQWVVSDMDVDGKKSTFIMTSQHNEIIAIDETE